MIDRVLLSLLLVVIPAGCWADDLVEFLSGSKLTGNVKQIRKEQKEFDFEVTVGARTSVRTYPFNRVHAVTMNGKRFVLTKMSSPVTADAEANGSRSRTEIEQLIKTVGGSPPDWLASTELEYPPSLDLSWPLKVEGGWNNQKNMGQYIWDVINPNPTRWRGGIKLVYHCMSLHEDQPELLRRDMQALAGMYFRFEQDYARAAYWFQRAGVQKMSQIGVKLAECYWRLGNAEMAMQQLHAGRNIIGSPPTVKLLGDMGATDKAIQLANQLGSSAAAVPAFLAAGDALRMAGRSQEAIEFYENVIASDQHRNKDYEQRFKARAQESIEAIRLFDQADPAKVADGTYQGFSTGYNGRLDVAVKVSDGKIESVKVTGHKEKQFYSALTDTEASILELQSVRGVDGTSGATITSQAIVNAAAKALASAAQ
jgi:uncharacterized protein with FMN-binding domain